MRLWLCFDKYRSAAGRCVRPAALLLTAILLATLLGAGALPAQPLLAQDAAQEPPRFDINQVTPPTGPPAARLGASSFAQNCAPCHGEQGMGDGPTAADLPGPPTAFADPDAVWERSPAQLFHTTKFGWLDKLMPPWQNQLSDEEIWQTVAFAWGLHTNEQATQQGAEFYAASCAGCHGESGAGDGPDATADQPLPDFSDPVYAMARSQADWMAGWQTAHPEIGAEWTLAEQRNVLEAVRTFSYVPAWESGLRPGNGIIRGAVVQGTAGGPAVESAQVTLEAFVDFQPMSAVTMTVDAGGQFEFTELSIEPNVVYLASVSSGGIRYSSPVVTLTAEQTEVDTVVTVYEVSDDPSGISLDRVHWILDSQPGALIVLQVMEFGNSSDSTYVGQQIEGIDEPVTVAFQMPAGAVELTFENGALGNRFQQSGDLIYDTTPLVPGSSTKQIVMQYALPHEGDNFALEQEFLYPIGLLNMLVADLPGLQVDAPALGSMGVQDFQGTSYQIWQAEQLDAGPLAINLSGLLAAGEADPRAAGDAAATAAGPVRSGAVSPFAAWMGWAMAIAVSLTLAGVLTWSWRAGRLQGGDAPQDLRRQRDELVQRVARLDDLQALGEIDREQWRVQRAQLKNKLLEIDGRLAEQGQAPRKAR